MRLWHLFGHTFGHTLRCTPGKVRGDNTVAGKRRIVTAGRGFTVEPERTATSMKVTTGRRHLGSSVGEEPRRFAGKPSRAARSAKPAGNRGGHVLCPWPAVSPPIHKK